MVSKKKKRGNVICPAPHERLMAILMPGRNRPTTTSPAPWRCTIRSAAASRSSPANRETVRLMGPPPARPIQ